MTRSRTENVKDKVMTGEEYPLLTIADASQQYVKSPSASEVNPRRFRRRKNNDLDDATASHRLQTFNRLKPNFRKVRSSLRKLNCFKSKEEESEQEIPIMDVQRHKSIDIGVGLARRMSLFLFTKKTTCVHPYHPYTPAQTTRKIYVFSEDKH